MCLLAAATLTTLIHTHTHTHTQSTTEEYCTLIGTGTIAWEMIVRRVIGCSMSCIYVSWAIGGVADAFVFELLPLIREA